MAAESTGIQYFQNTHEHLSYVLYIALQVNLIVRNILWKFLYTAKQFYLFLIFRSVQELAVRKFPGNVESRTVHSMAYRAVGHK